MIAEGMPTIRFPARDLGGQSTMPPPSSSTSCSRTRTVRVISPSGRADRAANTHASSVALEPKLSASVVPASDGQLLKAGQDLALCVGHGQAADPSQLLKKLRHLDRSQDQIAVWVDALQHQCLACSLHPVDEPDQDVSRIGERSS